MTVLPPGPDPAVLVTDDAVAAAQMADGDVVHRWAGGLPDARVRRLLEAAAFPIVAAWQHWEEEMLPDDGE